MLCGTVAEDPRWARACSAIVQAQAHTMIASDDPAGRIHGRTMYTTDQAVLAGPRVPAHLLLVAERTTTTFIVTIPQEVREGSAPKRRLALDGQRLPSPTLVPSKQCL